MFLVLSTAILANTFLRSVDLSAVVQITKSARYSRFLCKNFDVFILEAGLARLLGSWFLRTAVFATDR